jgi:hypothetical protein
MRKKIFLTVMALIMAVMMSGVQPTLAASNWNSINAKCTGGAGSFKDVATIRGFECIVANVLGIVLTVFALVGFLMFVYGGLMYMLSGGQPQKMEKARSTLGYVVIGLVLAVSAVAILNVVSWFTGVSSILTINWDAFGS